MVSKCLSTETLLVYLQRFCRLFLGKWLYHERLLLCSLLTLTLVEIKDLFVILSGSERARFNKIAEDRCICKLVDEAVWLGPVFGLSELLKVETVSRIHTLRHLAVFHVHIFEEALVIRHDSTHEL